MDYANTDILKQWIPRLNERRTQRFSKAYCQVKKGLSLAVGVNPLSSSLLETSKTGQTIPSCLSKAWNSESRLLKSVWLSASLGKDLEEAILALDIGSIESFRLSEPLRPPELRADFIFGMKCLKN